MIDLDEMKRDMEAGTPGPWTARWPVSQDHPFIDADCNHGEGPDGREYYMSVSGICSKEDARRICRVPDMEAAIIAQAATIEALRARVKAADELADMVQCWSENGCTESALTEALAAYRATGGAA